MIKTTGAEFRAFYTDPAIWKEGVYHEDGIFLVGDEELELKYEFTGETNKQGLRRIRAVRSFGSVQSGDVGGWIESESNLSHEGDCWVYGNARIGGDAWVYGNAHVSGNAYIGGDAWVYGNAHVSGNAYVGGDAWVSGNAHVSGNAYVGGDAWVSGNAHVYGNADFCVFDKFGSENRTTTAFKDSEIGIRVVCGCFTGSLQKFRDKINETHGDSKHGRLYRMMADMIELKLTPEGLIMSELERVLMEHGAKGE